MAALVSPRPDVMTMARAMVRTGGSSLLSALFSMTATKIVALVLGPSGVGLLSTLQQTRQVALVTATLNGQTALVQGASARRGVDRREYVRTIAFLFALASTVVSGLLMVAPDWTARLVGLGVTHPDLRWLVVPVLLSSAFVFLTAMLNAFGEVSRLAVLQLVSPLMLAVFAYPAAFVGGSLAFILMLTAAAAVSLAVAWNLLGEHRATVRQWFGGGSPWWTTSAALSFFSISGSMLLSGLVGSIAVVAVRSRILSHEGLASAGRFDAAWAISMSQVSLVLASMQAYLLPALTRSKDGAERSSHLTHAVLLATLAATPVVVTLIAFKATILSLLYSPQFVDGARMLRWTLFGDYLKIGSWICSLPMLAAGDAKAFLAADLLAYAVFTVAAWLLAARTSRAEAGAMAFVLMYSVHLVVCGMCAWLRHGARPGPRAVAAWVAGLAIVALTSTIFWEVR